MTDSEIRHRFAPPEPQRLGPVRDEWLRRYGGAQSGPADSDNQRAVDRVAAVREALQVLAAASNREAREFLLGPVDDELQLLESILSEDVR